MNSLNRFSAWNYLLRLLTVLLFETRRNFLEENGTLVIFGVSLIGMIYSAYLSYLEEYVIHAWCPYCIVSAMMITIIFILSILRLKQEGLL